MFVGGARIRQKMENRKFVVAILGLLSLVVVKAGGTCDIDGQWYDPTSTRNYQLIFRFESGGELVYAVTPNPQWGTGKVDYDPTSGSIAASLDDGEVIKGAVNSTTCAEISWSTPVATWVKLPQLKNVHVVFMNHLDVGYNGIPKTGFINNVLNTYFMEYFPRAIRLADEMQNIDPDSGFIYTTHTWLLYLYLNCPKNFVLNNITLYCPTPEEVGAMEQALKNGHVTWHTGPMNMQVELMTSSLIKMAVRMSDELGKKYKCCSQVWSLRDVPGMSGGAVPTLLQNKVKAVSVGVNPGSAPPAVPKLFQWRPYNTTNDTIVAMWHPGGYPLNPGSSLSSPGGISIMDSTISAEDGEALVFAFRTDNRGPPTSIAEIQNNFNVLREQYPGAKVFASTMDNFVNAVNASSLPIVYGEMGDTWIQGIASDPRKMILYRAAAKALTTCSLKSSCQYLDSLPSFIPYLIKLPEHTWGLPGVYSRANWSNDDFQKVKNSSGFVNAEQSWLEQRQFFNVTQELIMKNHDDDIYNYFVDEMKDLQLTLPDLNKFKTADPSTTFNISDKAFIAFGSDGSIIRFDVIHNGHTYSLADDDHHLGRFTYHTYNETDFQLMNSQYDYYGNAGYDKPNSTASASPKNAVYQFPFTGLYHSINDDATFLVELTGDPTAHTYYGAPEKVWIQVQVNLDSPMPELLFEVIIVDKTATRLAEATMFSFIPKLQEDNHRWQDRLYKVQSPDAPGTEQPYLSVFSVVKNGSFYQHAVEQVNMVEQFQAGMLNLGFISSDVPLVCPIFVGESNIRTPTPFPYLERPSVATSVDGFAFNIHNNIWNTNYPLWYPFAEEDKTFKARFKMTTSISE